MGSDPVNQIQPRSEYLEIGRFRLPSLSVVVIAAAALFLIALFVSDFNPPMADVKYDWLTAREAVRFDGDAYSAVTDLADRYDVEIAINADPSIDIPPSHPRTPASLLFQISLLLVPFSYLFALASVVSFLCIAWLATYRIEGNRRLEVLSLVAVFVIAPTFGTLRFAGQGAVVAFLALVGWLLIMGERPRWGGVLIGVAAALKVFPIVLLVPLLLQRRWRASSSLVGTVIVANLLGLSLPGVAFDRAIETLLGAASLWRNLYSNGSVSRVLQISGLDQTSATVIAVVLLAVVITALIRRNSWSPFGFLAIGLLVIPLSWVSYDLVLVPAAILMLIGPDRGAFYAGLGVVGAWVSPILLPWIPFSSGAFSFVARCIIVATAVWKSDVFVSWSMNSRLNGHDRVLN